MVKVNLVFFVLCVICFDGTAQQKEKRIKIILDREVFSDHFDVIFKSTDNAGINNRDALKIGEGYVALAGVYPDGRRTSIEERLWASNDLEIDIFVKGYSTGTYRLKIEGMDVVLKDKFMNISKMITAENNEYHFKIDSENKLSYGSNRFSLFFNFGKIVNEANIKTNKLIAYPNPCSERLFLNVKQFQLIACEVRIRNISGKIICRRSFNDLSNTEVLELDMQRLTGGMYLVELKDLQNNQFFKTLKIIKQ